MRLWLILFLLLTVGAWAKPPDLSGIEWVQHPGAALPLDAVFVDQAGQARTLAAWAGGRPTVIEFGYFECPALCGPTRDDLFAAMAGTGLVAGQDYTLLFVSIDPAETPSQAAAALTAEQRRHALPGEPRFLTGSPDAVQALTAATGFRTRFDPALKQFLHPAGLVLATPDGHVSSYRLGLGYTAGEMRGAVLRAQDGAILRAASPVLLLCFHFDATTGRYSLEVMKLLRLFAVLTVLTIAGGLLIMRRVERA